MSTQIGLLTLSAILVAVIGVQLAVAQRSDPQVQRARVGRFAREMGLRVPPELIPWVAGRLRRRATVMLVAVGGLTLGYLWWAALQPPPSSAGGHGRGRELVLGLLQPELVAAMGGVVVLAVLGGGYAAGHWADRLRERRVATTPAARGAGRLCDAMPCAVTWLVWLLTLAPVAVEAAAARHARAHADTLRAMWPWLVGCAAAVAAATAGTQWLQRRILQGGVATGATPAEQAVERAFAAQTAHLLVLWPAVAAVAATAVVVSHLAVGGPRQAAYYYFVDIPMAMGGILAPALAAMLWSRRYYRRRTAGSAAARGPSAASPETAG